MFRCGQHESRARAAQIFVPLQFVSIIATLVFVCGFFFIAAAVARSQQIYSTLHTLPSNQTRQLPRDKMQTVNKHKKQPYTNTKTSRRWFVVNDVLRRVHCHIYTREMHTSKHATNTLRSRASAKSYKSAFLVNVRGTIPHRFTHENYTVCWLNGNPCVEWHEPAATQTHKCTRVFSNSMSTRTVWRPFRWSGEHWLESGLIKSALAMRMHARQCQAHARARASARPLLLRAFKRAWTRSGKAYANRTGVCHPRNTTPHCILGNISHESYEA